MVHKGGGGPNFYPNGLWMTPNRFSKRIGRLLITKHKNDTFSKNLIGRLTFFDFATYKCPERY